MIPKTFYASIEEYPDKLYTNVYPPTAVIDRQIKNNINTPYEESMILHTNFSDRNFHTRRTTLPSLNILI